MSKTFTETLNEFPPGRPWFVKGQGKNPRGERDPAEAELDRRFSAHLFELKESMPMREISERYDMSINAVWTRIEKARDERRNTEWYLREALDAYAKTITRLQAIIAEADRERA